MMKTFVWLCSGAYFSNALVPFSRTGEKGNSLLLKYRNEPDTVIAETAPTVVNKPSAWPLAMATTSTAATAATRTATTTDRLLKNALQSSSDDNMLLLLPLMTLFVGMVLPTATIAATIPITFRSSSSPQATHDIVSKYRQSGLGGLLVEEIGKAALEETLLRVLPAMLLFSSSTAFGSLSSLVTVALFGSGLAAFVARKGSTTTKNEVLVHCYLSVLMLLSGSLALPLTARLLSLVYETTHTCLETNRQVRFANAQRRQSHRVDDDVDEGLHYVFDAFDKTQSGVLSSAELSDALTFCFPRKSFAIDLEGTVVDYPMFARLLKQLYQER